jgi:hypothetical protein
MARLNDGDEIKVTMALAAWRSFSRLRGETDYWRNLFEQRLAGLSEADQEEFHRLKEEPSGSQARIQHIGVRHATTR